MEVSGDLCYLPPWIHQVCWRAVSILPTIPMPCPATEQQTEGASNDHKNAWENTAIFFSYFRLLSFCLLGHRGWDRENNGGWKGSCWAQPDHWVLEIVTTLMPHFRSGFAKEQGLAPVSWEKKTKKQNKTLIFRALLISELHIKDCRPTEVKILLLIPVPQTPRSSTDD